MLRHGSIFRCDGMIYLVTPTFSSSSVSPTSIPESLCAASTTFACCGSTPQSSHRGGQPWHLPLRRLRRLRRQLPLRWSRRRRELLPTCAASPTSQRRRCGASTTCSSTSTRPRSSLDLERHDRDAVPAVHRARDAGDRGRAGHLGRSGLIQGPIQGLRSDPPGRARRRRKRPRTIRSPLNIGV